MPQTSVQCPRCRQPVVTDVQQLFDNAVDPTAKQRLLSGAANFIQCPACGYQGMLATPIVYHDPQKELLLTFFPPDMRLAVNEQEKMIGPLINQVVNHLPLEQRKAYLLQPRTMLTFELLMETVLEADGITKQMIEDQQKRLNLLQKLISTTPDKLKDAIQSDETLIDVDFFNLLTRLLEASLAQGDQSSAQKLAELQKTLIAETKVGQEMHAQAKEAEEAMRSLQDASKSGGLTREGLLDLVIDAPTETRLVTLVSLARAGMDYTFFQLLSEKIEKAEGDEKARLNNLRDQILQMTQEMDQAIQAQLAQTQKVLNTILEAPNTEEAIIKNANQINEFFMEVVKSELQAARKQGNLERSSKIQNVVDIIQKLSAPPPEVALVEELLDAEDDAARQQVLKNHASQITADFLQLFNGVVSQAEAQKQPPEVVQRLQEAYRAALRFSMESNIKKN